MICFKNRKQKNCFLILFISSNAHTWAADLVGFFVGFFSNYIDQSLDVKMPNAATIKEFFG